MGNSISKLKNVKREDLGGTMEETWKHFIATGKVEDYLKYKYEERELQQEVEPDGSKPNRNGTGYQCHANGRV